MITFNVIPSLGNTNPQNYLEEKIIIIHKKNSMSDPPQTNTV